MDHPPMDNKNNTEQGRTAEHTDCNNTASKRPETVDHFSSRSNVGNQTTSGLCEVVEDRKNKYLTVKAESSTTSKPYQTDDQDMTRHTTQCSSKPSKDDECKGENNTAVLTKVKGQKKMNKMESKPSQDSNGKEMHFQLPEVSLRADDTSEVPELSENIHSDARTDENINVLCEGPQDLHVNEASQNSSCCETSNKSQPNQEAGNEYMQSTLPKDPRVDVHAEKRSTEPSDSNTNPKKTRIVSDLAQTEEQTNVRNVSQNPSPDSTRTEKNKSVEPFKFDNGCAETVASEQSFSKSSSPTVDSSRKSMTKQSLELLDHKPTTKPCFSDETNNTTLQEITAQHTHLEQEEEEFTHNIQELANSGKKTRPDQKSVGSKYEEQKTHEMRKTEQLFNRLHLMEKHKQKIKTSDVLQLTSISLHLHEPCAENDLAQTFLQRLLMMDFRARYIPSKEEATDSDQTSPATEDEDEDSSFDEFLSKKPVSLEREINQHSVHPMDLQMAVFHCSDNFLKQLIVTKLSQCQYALPLLVPDPFTKQIEFPLWTFCQINKSWKTTDKSGNMISKTHPIHEAETPMVAFFRFGNVSSSKSQLINSLINENHATFFHRHCPGSSRNRVLMDGVVEIAWYCPSGKKTDHFTGCVAFCNLHGDAEANKDQLGLLTEMSSVNVVLLSDPTKVPDKETLSKLFKDPKPLICLLSEDDSGVTNNRSGKYRIGLKDRNQSDVCMDIRTSIKDCISRPHSKFSLDRLKKCKKITIDEDDSECKRGKEAALKIMRQLEGTDVSKLKEKHLPCQGKLWHKWCEMNKDLHRLQGNNLETQKCAKQKEMKRVREKQHTCGLSDLMKLFISTLNSSVGNDKLYFLKWVGILLNKFTSDDLSDLHYKYNEKWTKVLELKKKHDKSTKLKKEQRELEELSDKLNAANFGLEHILREMGQVYESFMSLQTQAKESVKENVSSFPKLAAELIISGFPMELMDGDAAHVPLIWVSAVLEELINELGDQRVFVLAVLGTQSSGKSTMLNAMFGLQFAVSAGRCTRGAFMQLVRVSEEKKAELQFDYILIVDTEGLRALELAGKSTCHHDNELATFVVGLGNMTLFNIFGENPSEIRDVLQIVVQAFLRMKAVRLKPSCMFVHQNVGGITAEEKNMEGRRRLQEILDEVTKLAAEEESDAEYFNDVITFSVQKDVQYVAQFWEGSPPMAPINPSYSENIQSLRNIIFQKVSSCNGVTLSQFKTSICDLWKALLNESFVFSFKNTLEIAVYRKLETEFKKWTWTLRSAMLDIEEKLHNRIENRQVKKIEEKDLYDDMKKTKQEVEQSMKFYFGENRGKDILIQWQVRCETKIHQLLEDLVKDANTNLNEVIQQQNARETFANKKAEYNEKLLNLSKKLAQSLKSKDIHDQVLEQTFNTEWQKWVNELTNETVPNKNDFWGHVLQILSADYDEAFVMKQQSHYKERGLLVNDKNESLTRYIIQETQRLIQDIGKQVVSHGYRREHVRQIINSVKQKVCRENQQLKLRNESGYTVDISLHVCNLAHKAFTKFDKQFREANDPRGYLEKQKPQYYSVFKKYYEGATSTAVLGDFICSNLQPSILQAAYNKTAIDLSAQIRSDMPEFNGNRSGLEKHILKTLAEEEIFEKYIKYIHKPKKHFKEFIKERVDKYISENGTKVLDLFKGNLKYKEQRVINDLTIATQEVKNRGGDADTWLKCFSSSLKDELSLKEITCTDMTNITNLDFLQKVINDGLMSEQYKSFNSVTDIVEKFRRKPDEILFEHLCQCCWVQCPFCKAICTNTIEDHDGDHSVPFHRIDGINGWHYRGTTEFCTEFCTTAVQSNKQFHPRHDEDITVPFKKYKTAGGEYEKWSITPDNSELPYWKWFVCRFKEDLENYYNIETHKYIDIPSGWRKFSKKQALDSLDEYL